MKIFLASPRGFCAGVDRAILIVENALKKYGSPIFVRHEIVHNKSVVDRLKTMGAVFVKEIDQCPPNSVVIFSAHGVPQQVVTDAVNRKLLYLDATCPLVSKVHRSVRRFSSKQKIILLIGHKGHPEVIGTLGQLPSGQIILIDSEDTAHSIQIPSSAELAYVTQTTLSIKETSTIIDILKKRFPSIQGPVQGDLCYATTNRQEAVSQLIPHIQLLLIVGSPNSSNSNRLREIGSVAGIPSYLIENETEVQESWFSNIDSIGISSGASAPEKIVQKLLDYLLQKFPHSSVEEKVLLEEEVLFALPNFPEIFPSSHIPHWIQNSIL